MFHLGLSLGLTAARAPRSMLQSLVPGDSNTFYVVAPADTGARVFRFIRNNAGDLSTPAMSLGAPFQPWRLGGIGWLDDRAGDPSDPDFWWSYGIGAQDVALHHNGTNLFGGSYHGGETASVNEILADGISVDPTQPAQAESFSLHHTSTIAFSVGNTATVTDYTLVVNADGTLTETLPVTSSLTFYNAYLGMIEATRAAPADFDETVVNDRAWVLPLPVGYVNPGSTGDVTIRDSASGRYIRSITDATGKSGYAGTDFAVTAARAKLYFRFTGAFGGSKTITRTIETGIGPTGSQLALGSTLLTNGDFAGGTTGWTVQLPAQVAVSSAVFQMTRHASSENRVFRAFSTTIGHWYMSRALFDGTLTGLRWGATSNSNSSVSSPAPAFFRDAVADTNVVVWQATQSTHYFMLSLLGGSAGQLATVDDCAVYHLGA